MAHMQREEDWAEVQRCANIFQFKYDGNPKYDRAAARAGPNQRLVKVFGIDNSITSTDNIWRATFISDATKKMRKAVQSTSSSSDDDWTGLTDLAKTCLSQFLARQKSSLNLTDLVRFVTLKLSMSYLFDCDASEDGDANYDQHLYIGKRINELWILSKNLDSSTLPKWEDEAELHESLMALIVEQLEKPMPGAFPPDALPFDPLSPRENPMNLLLPAFETMWRAVLRGVIEILFRGHASSSEWKEVLAQYLSAVQGPDKSTASGAFRRSSDGKASAIDIVKETLRLYPPSRRVHRDLLGQRVSADIEACQRTALLGHDDPLVFRPERWQDIRPDLRAEVVAGGPDAQKAPKTAEAGMGFMPFAFACPSDSQATKGFGMKLIALLMAVIIGGLDGGWVLANEDDEWDVLDLSVPLRNDRAAYERLRLEKM